MALAMLLAACASIGSPEGGPRDYTPPQVLKTSPAPNAVNFKGNKVEITFDEIVNLKDQQKKVVVSPAPKTQPLIRSVGKKLTIEFRDELEENTTYVIYYVGRTMLWRDCRLTFYKFVPGVHAPAGVAFDPARPRAEFDVYISLRYDAADGGTLFCDQVVAVELKTDCPKMQEFTR